MSKDNEEKQMVKTNPTKPADVQFGDVVMIVHYAKVTGNNRQFPKLQVENLDHEMPFEIHGDPLIASCYTADRFTEEVKMARTKICKILMGSWFVPFTVCYDKKDGTERVLRGRLLGLEEVDGYTQAEDLDAPKGDRFRQVDHRTLKWLIVRGVKYTSNSRK